MSMWIQRYRQGLFGLLLGMGIVSGVMWITLSSIQKNLSANHSIATVNVTRLIHQYISVMAKSSLTPEQSKIKIADFSHRLESALNEIAKTEHLVILPSEAVIAGAPDKTEEVIQRMKRGT